MGLSNAPTPISTVFEILQDLNFGELLEEFGLTREQVRVMPQHSAESVAALNSVLFDDGAPRTLPAQSYDARPVALLVVFSREILELGFPPDEARRQEAASRKHINDTRLLKRQLMEELSVWIAEHHLKQADAAEILMVSRPRVSDVVNKKTATITTDTLVEMLGRIGKAVRLAVS
jgi:predicted XRE-type DNA-binding protein